MTILELAKSFETLNGPDRTVTLFDGLFSESITDRDVKILHNLHSSLQLVLSKFGIDIFYSFETVRFSAS